MSYIHHTNVPNALFDMHLQNLGYAELKVLLVIIRQTYGWLDVNTGTYKKCDWISTRFFAKKTGLSNRAISSSISSLIKKQLILVKNKKRIIVHQAKQRRLEPKLYYSPRLIKNSEVIASKPMKQVHTTIIKHTKVYSEVSSKEKENQYNYTKNRMNYYNNKFGQ